MNTGTYVIEEWDGSIEVITVHVITDQGIAVVEYRGENSCCITMSEAALESMVLSHLDTHPSERTVRYSWQPLKGRWMWEMSN